MDQFGLNAVTNPLLSVVIPVRNEVAAIATLAREITTAFAPVDYDIEIVWVDDGSTDGTIDKLRQLTSPHRFIRFEHNCGQSAALLAGIINVQSEWVATLDGDGQNDPADLPKLFAKARAESIDLINGIRSQRHDNWLRRFSSRIANVVRTLLTGTAVHDIGCSTRVARRSSLMSLPRFDGMHRFLPTLVRMQGGRIGELPVNHRPRTTGRSKYGIGNRLFRGIRDVLGVRWLITRQRPWHIVETSESDTLTIPTREQVGK